MPLRRTLLLAGLAWIAIAMPAAADTVERVGSVIVVTAPTVGNVSVNQTGGNIEFSNGLGNAMTSSSCTDDATSVRCAQAGVTRIEITGGPGRTA
jgi:hypothetical protein